MRIASVASALPRHVYSQSALVEYLEREWADDPDAVRRMRLLHSNVQVESRHTALPLDEYAKLQTFSEFNDAYIRCAVDLGEQALMRALDRAGLRPRQVDAIFFSTVTGLASPSIDARLINRLGMRPDVKRMPLFGLGCVAGAATIARAADYVKAYPDQIAVALTIELCSLTLQRGDRSMANLISTGLFGDGASATVVVGERRREGDGPSIRDTRSVFYPDTEEVMGWHIGTEGFRIVLSPAVPSVAREFLPKDVDAFLRDHGLSRSQIASWVCHPGGPKVLSAMRDGLGLTDEDLAVSWSSLRRAGNLSSASLMLILEETMASRRPAKGANGMMLAMGPGFCSELLLLQW